MFRLLSPSPRRERTLRKKTRVRLFLHHTLHQSAKKCPETKRNRGRDSPEIPTPLLAIRLQKEERLPPLHRALQRVWNVPARLLRMHLFQGAKRSGTRRGEIKSTAQEKPSFCSPTTRFQGNREFKKYCTENSFF